MFIDETWVKTNMAPLRGWCSRGKRLIGKAPHGRWRTMTFIAALRIDGIDAPCVFDGRSTARASWPISNRCSFQSSNQGTSSSSTISVVTRGSR